MGDANHFTNAQRFALPTVIQMTALRAFSISKSPLLFHAVTTYSDNSANRFNTNFANMNELLLSLESLAGRRPAQGQRP